MNKTHYTHQVHNTLKPMSQEEAIELDLVGKIAQLEQNKKATDLLLCGILLGRFEPLAPHHVSWIKERVNYTTDEELRNRIKRGF